jgi:hypothetical protein
MFEVSMAIMWQENREGYIGEVTRRVRVPDTSCTNGQGGWESPGILDLIFLCVFCLQLKVDALIAKTCGFENTLQLI